MVFELILLFLFQVNFLCFIFNSEYKDFEKKYKEKEKIKYKDGSLEKYKDKYKDRDKERRKEEKVQNFVLRGNKS